MLAGATFVRTPGIPMFCVGPSICSAIGEVRPKEVLSLLLPSSSLAVVAVIALVSYRGDSASLARAF